MLIPRPFTASPMIVRLPVIRMISSISGGVEKPCTIPANTSAFIGFTAGTGSNYGNHDILNWAYSPSYVVGGISSVPEPGTYALLGLGGLMLLGLRRLKRAR